MSKRRTRRKRKGKQGFKKQVLTLVAMLLVALYAWAGENGRRRYLIHSVGLIRV
ncbi:hypothetical protein Q0F98_04135 [Paenibacillus amylolyticus]|nr:hypothetical protein Q0F98_04135 [Paenibacillus amylolyticus]